MPFLNPGDLDEWVHTLTALATENRRRRDSPSPNRHHHPKHVWPVGVNEVPIHGVCEEGIDVLIFFSSPSRMCPASHTPQEMKSLNRAMYVSNT